MVRYASQYHELESVSVVIGVDVITSSVYPTNQWTLELTL